MTVIPCRLMRHVGASTGVVLQRFACSVEGMSYLLCARELVAEDPACMLREGQSAHLFATACRVCVCL